MPTDTTIIDQLHKVYFTVPTGGSWSGEQLEITAKTPVTVILTEVISNNRPKL